MEKEIYTPMEQVLVQGALLAEALQTKQNLAKALELDVMLLKLEAQADMYEGKKMEEWLL